MFSNRFVIGVISFGVSFGLSLVFTWNFGESLRTSIITVMATYLAAFCADRRRRYHEMLIMDSLHRRIRELEGIKSHFSTEINQLENRRNSLYSETSQLQNQISDRRNQRDSLNRELGSFLGQKQQYEAVIHQLQAEIDSLEKSKIELNNSLSVEKRKQELNVSVSRAEITQLQIHINELKKEQEERENNLTLLERLKPQLEEKLHELRVQIQEFENQEQQKNQLLSAKVDEKKTIEAKIKSLQAKVTAKQEELKHLQNQINLLQDERNLLQSQVWELLQQMETLNPVMDAQAQDESENESEFFPFSDLLDLDGNSKNNSDNRLGTWNDLLHKLPNHELQVLKAILEQENPNPTIKQIAEANISMPNLLIDDINGRANDIIGELIIDTNSEYPTVYPEHLANVKKLIETYEEIIAQRASSN